MHQFHYVPNPYGPEIIAVIGGLIVVGGYWSIERPPRHVVARTIGVLASGLTAVYAYVGIDAAYTASTWPTAIGSALVVIVCMLYELRAAQLARKAAEPPRCRVVAEGIRSRACSSIAPRRTRASSRC